MEARNYNYKSFLWCVFDFWVFVCLFVFVLLSLGADVKSICKATPICKWVDPSWPCAGEQIFTQSVGEPAADGKKGLEEQ